MSKKHVVVLGAGASVMSGYPDAERLTVLMCDRVEFVRALNVQLEAQGERSDGVWNTSCVIRKYYQSFGSVTSLLRGGDFATMDELSNLAVGGNRAGDALKLKELMRFILAMHNPDITHWAKSDYRAFIQALFSRESRLRDDVCVLSFNYDPFLEYRLLRALECREKARPTDAAYFARARQAVTSGLLYPGDDLKWIEGPGFVHLKLHGTAALPARSRMPTITWPPQPNESKVLTSDHFFRLDALARLKCLANPEYSHQQPPVLLPWEIISNDGKLLEWGPFLEAVGQDWQHKELYKVFQAIWCRARSEIQDADKISFVGLSIGAFLEPELKFLFEGKHNMTQFVVANPETQYPNWNRQDNPHARCGKVIELLTRFCPQMRMRPSDRDISHVPPNAMYVSRPDGMTARRDFAEFTLTEL